MATHHDRLKIFFNDKIISTTTACHINTWSYMTEDEIQKEMNRLIDCENYELAAELRDYLKSQRER